MRWFLHTADKNCLYCLHNNGYNHSWKFWTVNCSYSHLIIYTHLTQGFNSIPMFPFWIGFLSVWSITFCSVEELTHLTAVNTLMLCLCLAYKTMSGFCCRGHAVAVVMWSQLPLTVCCLCIELQCFHRAPEPKWWAQLLFTWIQWQKKRRDDQ